MGGGLAPSTAVLSKRLRRAPIALRRTRDSIRLEVEQSFFGLRTAVQNIQTTASEVLSSRGNPSVCLSFVFRPV